jgi:hypothetical protein
MTSAWETSAFITSNKKLSQFDFYKKNNATENVLSLVKLQSKTFGTICEKIVYEMLNLQPRTSSQNDATYNNNKIEIKCARYWSETNNCKWQHIEIGHDFDFILFVLLDFTDFKIWGIKKKKLIKIGKLTKQGLQGMWVNKNDIIEHLTQIYPLSA